MKQVNSVHNRSYRAVKGDEEGIGRSDPIDRTEEFGSAGRLRGFVDYPVSNLFDNASPSGIHEIAHRWMVFIDVEGLSIRVGSHWAPGTAAEGIMGSTIGGQGIQFRFELVEIGPNEHELRCVDRPRAYNDLELYLMGLLPADSVGPHVVFDDPEIELACGSRGTTTPFTIEDVAETNGARDPAYPDAPTDFRLANMVLSRGRLLTEEELSFFDQMAARGEAREELPYTEGFVRGTTKPFYLGTGGRETLTTRVWE